MPKALTCLLFSSILAFCTACGQPVTKAEETVQQPTRRQLTRNAMRASVWRFVYCLREGEDPAQLKELLERVAAAQPFGKRIDVVNCQDLQADDLANNSFSIFGNQLPPGAEPIDVRGSNIIPHRSRSEEEVLLLPYYDNPWGEKQAVVGFYLADDVTRLITVLESEYENDWNQILRPKWAYEIHSKKGERIYGNYSDTTWAFDQEKEMVLAAPDVPVYDQDGLQIFVYDGVTSNNDKNLVIRALNKVYEITKKSDYPEVRLYPSLERIGIRLGEMRPIQYDHRQHILHVVPSFISEDDLLLDLVTWHSFLARSQVQSEETRAMLAKAQHRLSAAIGEDRYGKRMAEALRVASTGILKQPNQENPSDFILEALARVNAIEQGLPRVAPPSRYGTPVRPLAGMTFAHQGYRVHNGYGGEKIKPSLDSLAKINVNALAVVPYTFLRNPNTPTSLFIPSDAGQENDWATACSVREAKSKNWFVLLKPQIWLGGGHWPGDVDFVSDEEWDTFFEHYSYWILHYAVLAEREKADALCIGTELVQTTIKQADRWKELIRKIRSVYGGQLTYAANWGEEFENFSFWEDLDAIGLNSYYPLSDKETPTDEELLAGARNWLAMAADHSRKVKRPLWLTEVGFRSVKAAWQHPHAEAGEKATSLTDQARCYNALLTAAANVPELRGAFFWKWPTYLGHGRDRNENRYFTPGGKPAARRLAEFYGKWNNVR